TTVSTNTLSATGSKIRPAVPEAWNQRLTAPSARSLRAAATTAPTLQPAGTHGKPTPRASRASERMLGTARTRRETTEASLGRCPVAGQRYSPAQMAKSHAGASSTDTGFENRAGGRPSKP